MKQGLEDEPRKFEGLTPEDVEALRELEATVGAGGTPEDLQIAREAVEQERLRILLTYAFGDMDSALYARVCAMAQPSLPTPDSEQFVAENLISPDNSPVRVQLIETFSNEPDTRDVVSLLREMERFLEKAPR